MPPKKASKKKPSPSPPKKASKKKPSPSPPKKASKKKPSPPPPKKASKKKPSPPPLWNLEWKRIEEMRKIVWDVDSPNPETMYTAASGIMTISHPRALLPKAIDLLTASDASLKKLVFRMVGRNVYGKYVPELFRAMEDVNPAEREAVLQSVEEGFILAGGPITMNSQKVWVDALASLGREHQSTVFGLMAQLGVPGTRWVTKLIRDHVETISLGAVPRILVFPEKTRNKMIQLLCQKAAAKKPELVTYISGIVGPQTIRFLLPFLKEGQWQDRAEVAKAVGRLGVISATGIIMDIIADPDWRVKQALLESINVAASKLSSLIRILGYFVTDSHTRVRGLAERNVLMMGSVPCMDSDLETQRKKIHRKFRKQLLRAAPVNQDLDSSWLGVGPSDLDPIPFMPEEETSPEGLTLSDIEPAKEEEPEATAAAEGQKDLLTALLSARQTSPTPDSDQEAAAPEPASVDDFAIEVEASSSDHFIRLLKGLAKSKGTDDVFLADLKATAKADGMGSKEFDRILEELELDGIIYRSKKGKLRYVDMDL